MEGLLESTGEMLTVWGLRPKALPARKTPRATFGHLRHLQVLQPLQGL